MDLQGQLKVNKRRKKETNRLYIYKAVLINCEGLIGLSPANTDSFIILNIILKQRFLSVTFISSRIARIPLIFLFKNNKNWEI